MQRRQFLLRTLAAAPLALGVRPRSLWGQEAAAEPIKIGKRRELFIDDYLIDRLVGRAEQRLHEPQPREVAMVFDRPWEGAGSGYHSLFRDGDRYRLYYRGQHIEIRDKKLRTDAHPAVLCCAESDDGITWRRPEYGLHEFNGSKANNIVLVEKQFGEIQADPAHAAIFKDDNPAASEDARYKAILRSPKPFGLLALKSPDGLRWSLMSERPVITNGAFDSQNLAFWDAERGEYRAYWRYFTGGETIAGKWKPSGIRAIRTARSQDFLHWTDEADLTYIDSPAEEMYTNQVKPYARAPHILLGFPVRYVNRGWSESMRELPDRENREQRAAANQRYGTALTECLLMASRDGVHFKRWNEAFLRPGPEREGTWQYGQHYVAWHVVETRSMLFPQQSELSLYSSESYWTGESCALRRYGLRLDGFVSIQAPSSGGELVTKPLVFEGRELSLNFSTSAVGSVQVEVQSAAGEPLPGLSLTDCETLFGDTLDRRARWPQGKLAELAGKPVRLRFVLRDADLYSFCFVA